MTEPSVRTATASPRRARRLLPVLACLAATAVVLGISGGSSAAEEVTPGRQSTAERTPDELVTAGRALFATGCVSCHGVDGRGQDTPDGSLRGPTLEEAGEAGAYYQLTTGRMPLANPGDTPQRKEPAYAPDEIEALVAYVSTLGDGPELPDVDIAAGDLAEGGELYRNNCQACHSATGAGGALSYGRAAPPLAAASPAQIGAAIRSGPQPMPRFGPDLLDQEELNSVARYVQYLEDPDDRGGLSLGRLGPIPEGFMIWVGGLGLLLVAAYWMGERRDTAETVDPVPPGESDAEGDPGTEGVDAGGNASLAWAESRGREEET
jgi:ubiquinol-cytochrome c reductase cytochrome c subunit